MQDGGAVLLPFEENAPVKDVRASVSDYRKHEDAVIIIDNGSHTCRVGWSTETDPRLNFRALAGKPRGAKKSAEGESLMQVGGDLQVDAWRKMNLRSAYDGDIISRLDVQEHIFDYAFDRLGIDTQSIEHSVVLTETLCNPNFCRKEMSELLFECYGVPSVCYGVDSLFSYYYNTRDASQQDALILSSGNKSTYLMAISSGRTLGNSIKRIPLGGSHSTQYMQDLFQLKFPFHRSTITTSKAEFIKETHAYVALDYKEELWKYQHDPVFAAQHMRVFQLPYTPMAQDKVLTPDQLLKKQEKRKEQGLRLRKILEEKRKEKKEQQKLELEALLLIRELKETHPATFQKKLAAHGYTTEKELEAGIKKLTVAVHGAAPKKEQTEEEKYPLLEVDDSLLTPEQLEEKKKQRFLKNIRDGQARAKENREKARQERVHKEQTVAVTDDIQEKQQKQEEEERQKDPATWAANLKKRIEELKQSLNRKRKRTESISGRHGAATQQRLRVMAEAAFDAPPSKRAATEEDTFGANDADWDVYLTMSAEGQEQLLQEEQKEIERMEVLLREHGQLPELQHLEQEGERHERDYQIYMGVERVRVPEIIFQPSMVGIDAMSLPYLANYILVGLPPATRDNLVQNIFVTGGNTLYPQFLDRVESDLRSLRPVDSVIKVWRASDPVLDPWRGMRIWALQPEFPKSCITRQIYEEAGAEYLQEHALSNIYSSLPK